MTLIFSTSFCQTRFDTVNFDNVNYTLLNELLLEKANDERIKAEDDQFQLSLDLMAEGQEKELLMNSIGYDKKYDQAHGNAELQYQLRVQ